MKNHHFRAKPTACVLAALVIACVGFNALANPVPAPIPAPGTVVSIPKSPGRSIVDIQLDALDITSSSGGGSFVRPQIRNASKQAVGVTIEATVHLTGKMNALVNKKTSVITEQKTIPAQTQLSTDLLLPVTTCAKITVTVTPEKNVLDANMSNNTKTVVLPCPK